MRSGLVVMATAAAVVVMPHLSMASALSPALIVRIMSGSQAGLGTTFERDADAPRSSFQKAGLDSSLQSVFQASEVAPERVETTRTLLTQLNARRTEGTIIVDLPADVLFDFDKADLRPDAEQALTQAAELLRSYPTATVSIGGHTDAKGDDAYNNALSVRRARAVADRLGSAIGRTLGSEGFGETRPVAANALPDGRDDPAGRQKNRRVEILIRPQLQEN